MYYVNKTFAYGDRVTHIVFEFRSLMDLVCATYQPSSARTYSRSATMSFTSYYFSYIFF